MSDESARWEKWENTRAKGRWSYILKYGVLYWGVTAGVLFSLIGHLVMDEPQPSLFQNIIIFGIAGIGRGAWRWILAEKKYARFKSASHDEE
jgi:hypothetical protein